MPFINEEARELNAKIVYSGPPLAGKTANLQYLYDHAPKQGRGKLVSLATETERTLLFDFLPELEPIRGYAVRIHVYTVPGSVFYDSSRVTALKGVSGVVFVADSQFERLEANLEQLDTLHENLTQHGLRPEMLPTVFQHNKRDLPNVASTRVLDRLLGVGERPGFAACARVGKGVHETFMTCAKAVHDELVREPSNAIYR